MVEQWNNHGITVELLMVEQWNMWWWNSGTEMVEHGMMEL